MFLKPVSPSSFTVKRSNYQIEKRGKCSQNQTYTAQQATVNSEQWGWEWCDVSVHWPGRVLLMCGAGPGGGCCSAAGGQWVSGGFLKQSQTRHRAETRAESSQQTVGSSLTEAGSLLLAMMMWTDEVNSDDLRAGVSQRDDIMIYQLSVKSECGKVLWCLFHFH